MITQGQVKKLFDYRDGSLYRKTSPCNSTRIGDKVGSVDKNGYLTVMISGSNQFIHRVVYLYFFGSTPKIIDHIDGNPLNNKIENLRHCSQRQNTYNAKISKNNTTGIKGVTWITKRKMYVAQLISNGKSYFLGYFDDKYVAGQIVRIKRIELHGEFANHG